MTPEQTRFNHFDRLNSYRKSKEYDHWSKVIGFGGKGEYPSLAGDCWKIDEAIYDEFLNMLPPIYTPGGFFISEETFDGFHAKFTREGDLYWCEFARLPSRVNAPRLEP